MPKYDSADTDVFVSARNLDEYIQMFSLSEVDLRQKILDCAAGAASFTSELNGAGGCVIAADPLYAEDFETIEARTMAGVAQASGNVYKESDRYNWTFLSDPKAHYATRLRSAQYFLADFRSHPNSFVPGALPSLPFADQAFDIVLCSHLLFVYAGILDAEFHKQAILELLRVCSQEIRVFPIVGFRQSAEDIILEVLTFLASIGVNARTVPVNYHFLKGSGNMLCISR